MEDMQAQMGAILNNPEMMQKIMSMAQSLQPPQQESAPPPPSNGSGSDFSMPDIDIGMLQKLSGIASQSGVDQNQRNLLQALSPYLSSQRVSKLEKAMRAAKMARFASSWIGQSGSPFGFGR